MVVDVKKHAPSQVTKACIEEAGILALQEERKLEKYST